jgi:hypothetical protein
MSVRVYLGYERAEFCGFKPLVEELGKAVPGKPWLAWPPGQPWGTADRWARELVGMPWVKLMAIVREIDPPVAQELEVIAAPDEVGPGQRHRSDLEPRADGTKLKRGETSSYLATRLKKDHAELAAEVEAGRMKLRAAARAAGIIKPPDPVKELMRWWWRSRPEQRAVCLDLIATEPFEKEIA